MRQATVGNVTITANDDVFMVEAKAGWDEVEYRATLDALGMSHGLCEWDDEWDEDGTTVTVFRCVA